MASSEARHRPAAAMTVTLAASSAVSALLLAAAALPLLPGPAMPMAADAAELLPLVGFLAVVFWLPLVAGAAAVLWALDRGEPPRARAAWAALCVAWAAGSLAVGWYGETAAREFRYQGYAALARRSQPLVEAIGAYQRDHGQLPPTLAALVPDYLPAVPTPGLLGGYQWDYQATVPWSLGFDCWWAFNIEYFRYTGGAPAPDDLAGSAAKRRRAVGPWTFSWVSP